MKILAEQFNVDYGTIKWHAKYGNSRENLIRYRKKLKKEALINYSNNKLPFCKCCKTKYEVFLTIDHINGRTKHNDKKGHALYLFLKKKNYPKGYQVLCFNCNYAKHMLGKCPHNSV